MREDLLGGILSPRCWNRSAPVPPSTSRSTLQAPSDLKIANRKSQIHQSLGPFTRCPALLWGIFPNCCLLDRSAGGLRSGESPCLAGVWRPRRNPGTAQATEPSYSNHARTSYDNEKRLLELPAAPPARCC